RLLDWYSARPVRPPVPGPSSRQHLMARGWLPDLLGAIWRVNGDEQIDRQAVNFIAGDGVEITAEDNPATEACDVTISASGGGGGIDADGFAYQGDVVLSETLAIPPSGYALVLEIPVTIREGKLHAIAWRCPLYVNSGSGVASFLVELFLGTTSGLF